MFLEAVASLGLVVSLSQSVTESGSHVLVKLDKVSIGGLGKVLYSLIYSCIVVYSPA